MLATPARPRPGRSRGGLWSRAAGREGRIAWLSAVALACSAPVAPFAPGAAVARLGEPAGSARIGAVSRPLLRLDDPGAARLPLRRLAPGRLLLAAGRAEDAPGSGPVTCRAELESGGGSRELAVLEPTAARWAEAEASLPAVADGVLALTCRDADGAPAAALWARPLLLPREPEASPLIVLLSLDTLRADHVAGFGGDAALTPQLDALGREGLRMTDAVSEGTWTLASHFALLYSRLYGFPVTTRPLVSLADALAEAGFASVAFTGGGFMGAAFHYDRGFDRFAEYATGEDELGRVLDDAAGWIERLGPAPSFVFVHTYAVHEYPPEEVRWHESHGAFATFRPTPAQIRRARDFYRGIVARTDAVLGTLFERLRDLAKRRPVLLVVVSDHGEAFGEHGNFRHGYGDASVTLHDEVVRVPFIVWGPGAVPPGRSSDAPAMLGDVGPSLLAAAGQKPPPGMVGADLWPLWSGREPAPGSPAVSHTQGGWALRTASRKLIVQHDAGRQRHVELYDLTADPGERRDLAGERPAELEASTRQLRERLATLGVPAPAPGRDYPVCPLCAFNDATAFWAQALEQPSRELDAETRQRLRDLGYID